MNEVLPDQRAIFEKVFEMDAARHAAGIPSAIEYHRALGEGQIDPAVAAAHRWLDSFLPEEAPLQWRRIMGASGHRGKNIATVLQSPLGLGVQAAPNTAIPGSPMPVYSGRRGYRPPPLPAAPGATPAAPQPYTTANRPSLFGPLEARRDWALGKVRELETIAADPNRSQRDRESARRGARQITRDIANYQGMPFTPEELNAEVNPLLSRMEAWDGHTKTPGVSGLENDSNGSVSFESPPESDFNVDSGLETLEEVKKAANNIPAIATPSSPSIKIPRTYQEAMTALQPLAAESRLIRNEWRQLSLAATDVNQRIRSKSTSVEERTRLEGLVSDMAQRLNMLVERQAALAAEARELIAIPSAERGRVRWKHKLGGDIGKLAEASGELTAQYVDASLLPSLSVEIAPDGTRAKYRPKTKTIRLNPRKADISTGMHEIAHAIEHQMAGILGKTVSFLGGRRSKGEKPARLIEVYPNEGYEPNHWLLKDKWLLRGGKSYTGRFYLNKRGRIRGTEILTTGLQRLHADPADFLDQDPEFFRFIITTLRYPTL